MARALVIAGLLVWPFAAMAEEAEASDVGAAADVEAFHCLRGGAVEFQHAGGGGFDGAGRGKAAFEGRGDDARAERFGE